jgi:AraC family transcriptional regulator
VIPVNLKGAEPMSNHIVERESFQIAGIKREFPCGTCEEGIPGIPEFWGEANTNGTVNKLIPLLNVQIKGLLGVTGNYNKEKIRLIIGLLRNITVMCQLNMKA